MDTGPRTKGNEGQPVLSPPLLVCQALTRCCALLSRVILSEAGESATAEEI